MYIVDVSKIDNDVVKTKRYKFNDFESAGIFFETMQVEKARFSAKVYRAHKMYDVAIINDDTRKIIKMARIQNGFIKELV